MAKLTALPRPSSCI